MYGEVALKYKGDHPAIFGFTALGAGLGAVAGFSRGGLAGALMGMLAGGVLGLVAGYLFEVVMGKLMETRDRVVTRRRSIKTYYIA